MEDENEHIEMEWDRKEELPGISGFITWPMAQYVEDYGHNYFKESMEAMREITKRFTSEFAIRPFIDIYKQRLYKKVTQWTKNKNHHVRRLCSEGIRPHLPWGLKSEYVINNLEENIKVLELLKNDHSDYVRKSVANHLNDISKIDEDLFLKTITKWKRTNKSPEMAKLIRHASRTLLKKGHPKILKLHGYHSVNVKLKKLKLSPKNISEGENLNLELELLNNNKKKSKVLIEYIIHYKKKNGHSAKTFRLKDTELKDSLKIEKNILFKKVTTRKHYPGMHYLEVQINGHILGKRKFVLDEA